MKKALLLAGAMLGMLAASPAWASNQATVAQVGDNNRVLVDQGETFNVNGTGYASIDQAGSNNKIRVDQSDGITRGAAGDHNPPGYHNVAVITQRGHDNAINDGLLLPAVEPADGFGQSNSSLIGLLNQVSITQIGDSDTVLYRQAGGGHVFAAYQTGQRSIIRLTQTGNSNAANANQTADDSQLNFSQVGNFGRADINQSGSDNRASINQYGDFDIASFNQSGVDNTLFVNQVSNNAQAVVTQGGTNNFTQIVH